MNETGVGSQFLIAHTRSPGRDGNGHLQTGEGEGEGEGGAQLCGSSESMASYVYSAVPGRAFLIGAAPVTTLYVACTGKLVSCVAKAYHHDAEPRPESIACPIHLS